MFLWKKLILTIIKLTIWLLNLHDLTKWKALTHLEYSSPRYLGLSQFFQWKAKITT